MFASEYFDWCQQRWKNEKKNNAIYSAPGIMLLHHPTDALARFFFQTRVVNSRFYLHTFHGDGPISMLPCFIKCYLFCSMNHTKQFQNTSCGARKNDIKRTPTAWRPCQEVSINTIYHHQTWTSCIIVVHHRNHHHYYCDQHEHKHQHITTSIKIKNYETLALQNFQRIWMVCKSSRASPNENLLFVPWPP